MELSINIEEEFNGIPDLVIADYEPNVIQYAYVRNLHVICIEQQSKFIYISDDIILGFSSIEEKSRLNYFEPRFDKKIISSFFDININDQKVEVVPPIIGEVIRS